MTKSDQPANAASRNSICADRWMAMLTRAILFWVVSALLAASFANAFGQATPPRVTNAPGLQIPDAPPGPSSLLTNAQAASLEEIRAAANHDDSDAMVELGLRYHQGSGTGKDDGEAVKWFLKASDAGNMEGLYRLGLMYQDGLGVTQDCSKSIQCLIKAAVKGQFQRREQPGRCLSERPRRSRRLRRGQGLVSESRRRNAVARRRVSLITV